MFRFFLKKNFLDAWDNLGHNVLVNSIIWISTILLAGGIFFADRLPGPASIKGLYLILALVFACSVVNILVVAQGENALAMVSFEGASWKKFFSNIKASVKDGILFGLYISFLCALAVICIPFYYRMWVPADGSDGSIIGFVMLVLLFWFVMGSILALQYFVPIRSMMGNNFKKCLKKSYIIFLDNLFFTFGLAIVNLVNLVLMLVSIGLVSGPATIAMTCSEALRILMYKYDWIEVNPDLTLQERKEVPWEELLANDESIVGPLNIKRLLFPWKQQ